MPRTWLQEPARSEVFASAGPPKFSEIFRLTYGEDWNNRMSAVFGRKHDTVKKWGNGGLPVPRYVLEHVLDRCCASRTAHDLRRTLVAAMEREYSHRMEGMAASARWLKLLLEQKRTG